MSRTFKLHIADSQQQARSLSPQPKNPLKFVNPDSTYHALLSKPRTLNPNPETLHPANPDLKENANQQLLLSRNWKSIRSESLADKDFGIYGLSLDPKLSNGKGSLALEAEPKRPGNRPNTSAASGPKGCCTIASCHWRVKPPAWAWNGRHRFKALPDHACRYANLVCSISNES